MEVIIFIILLYFITRLVKAIFCWGYRRWKAYQQKNRQSREQYRKLNLKYRGLQIALQQIHHAHDFQRAAMQAKAAKGIPMSERQRQYRRFRKQLVKHFVRRLRVGVDSETLLDSLTTLIEALGIASFEAAYIQQEATEQIQSQHRNQHSARQYLSTLEQMQQEHRDRSEALQQSSLDDEMKEQLLEVQNQQLADSLMEMTLRQQEDNS